MEERSVTHSTFVIERAYSAAPERVFAAFADPVKKRRWFAEGGRDVEEFEMDFRAGGTESARYRLREGTPFPGATYSTYTVYEDIVPGRRIVFVYSTNFGGRCISACLATIEILPVDTGTNLVLTHQGAYFEGADGPGRREEGWRTILDRLPEELAL